MKRLFIAIDIHPGDRLKEAMELVRNRLRTERINWVNPKQLHLTISFLGDTPGEIVPLITSGLKKALNGCTSFELTLASMGVFKNIHDPRVIWIGCRENESFRHIKKEIDLALAEIGIEQEVREFSPHLTLGRIKGMRQQNQLAQLITLNKDVIFQDQRIENIVLYESRLSSEGPEYLPLQWFPLKKQG